ncbi:hypothetical protein KQC08_13340, partial [Leptospira sp. Pond_2020]|nr:hypothetical protein [Leptospira sp. Pond_2020]
MDEGTLILPIEVQVDYSGKLPDKLVPFIPHKSKLVKSCVYGYDGLTSNKHPAILSRHDKRYQYEEGPLIAGVSKHGLLTKNFPTEVLDMAFEGLWDNLFVSMRPLILEPRKLTRKQAVIGLDHEAYPGMELDKSAGYPWMLTTRKSEGQYIGIDRWSDS